MAWKSTRLRIHCVAMRECPTNNNNERKEKKRADKSSYNNIKYSIIVYLVKKKNTLNISTTQYTANRSIAYT